MGRTGHSHSRSSLDLAARSSVQLRAATICIRRDKGGCSDDIRGRSHEYAAVTDMFRRLATLDEESVEYRRQRDMIVECCLPLADHIARRFSNRGEPFEDLVQVARVGLLNAVNRFDAENGADFLAFAVPTIDGRSPQALSRPRVVGQGPPPAQRAQFAAEKVPRGVVSSIGSCADSQRDCRRPGNRSGRGGAGADRFQRVLHPFLGCAGRAQATTATRDRLVTASGDLTPISTRCSTSKRSVRSWRRCQNASRWF